jgi:osmoprotectant transport system substrate-binding protein
MRRIATPLIVLAAAVAALVFPFPARACVGRTILIGYHDAPDQVMVANILAVFIDERTGTTVKLSRFRTREEAFEAVRNDKVSLYSDYSSILLSKFAGERPSGDDGKNIARLKEVRTGNTTWSGWNRSGTTGTFPRRRTTGRNPARPG